MYKKVLLKVKYIYSKIFRKIKSIKYRIKLKNKKFTIISDNCWGGFLYQDLNLQYRTPFIGLFLFAPDYIKLLENLPYYMSQKLLFIDKSKYEKDFPKKDIIGKYPMATLGGDVEIHFLHYKNKVQAEEKWNERVKRMNWDNMYIKLGERGLCDQEILNRFDKLKYKNKVCFTTKKYKNINSCICIDEFKDKKYVDSEWMYYKKYFNIIEWLNRN